MRQPFCCQISYLKNISIRYNMFPRPCGTTKTPKNLPRSPPSTRINIPQRDCDANKQTYLIHINNCILCQETPHNSKQEFFKLELFLFYKNKCDFLNMDSPAFEQTPTIFLTSGMSLLCSFFFLF